MFFNGFIVLQDLLLFVNVSVFLNSEFVKLADVYTDIFYYFVYYCCFYIYYFTGKVYCLSPYWLAVASLILWLL